MNTNKTKQCNKTYIPSLLSKSLIIFASSLLLTDTAISLQYNADNLQVNLDNTLSYGLTWRVQGQDKDIIGTANGGNAQSVNYDDGNLNYDTGIVSNAIKITSDLEIAYKTSGAFFRGSGFYDFEHENGHREKSELTTEALDLIGSDINLLDAYLWHEFELNTMPAQIRVGDQVLSWGESTFIQNSINVINPVNVSALRIPGAELKEALIPEGMLWSSLSPSNFTTVELFYLYDWKETVVDPPGSYWSTNDFAGEGGNRVMLGWGVIADTSTNAATYVPRSANQEASDSGQYGIAFRWYSNLFNDTEFGFYFMNYHSRLPINNAKTGTAAAAAGADPQGRSYIETSSYFVSYPEDIKLYGISFNTQLLKSGIALQGEFSFRQDVPLQVDDVELLFALLGAQDTLSPGNTAAAGFAAYGQLGSVGFETEIPGYIERNVSQFQTTATKVFGPTLGADQWLILGEIGVSHVNDMPDKNELRLNGPGTPVSGNSNLAAAHAPYPIEPASAFADATSWGYRLVSRLQYNNAIGAISLTPRIAWQHDVNGTSPGPGGNFVEDRKAVSLGVNSNYQNRWVTDISYTSYFGAGRYNLLNDRDIISANVQYSF